MKKYLIFLFIPFFISCSFVDKPLVEVITVIQLDSESDFQKSEIIKLKDEINKRMSSRSFNIEFSLLNQETKQITTKSKITKNKLELYNSLFERHSVEFWNTYQMNDEVFKAFDLKNISIEGFSLNFKDDYEKKSFSIEEFSSVDNNSEILGFFYDEASFDSIKYKLNHQFRLIPNIEFYYLKMNSMESSNEYGIYMINTENSKDAPITNKYIIEAKKRETKHYPYQMIFCQLDDFGSIVWENMTEKAANENRKIAIVLDGKLLICPAVHERISGGGTSIVGFEEGEDLNVIANGINFSKLSFNLKIINQRVNEK